MGASPFPPSNIYATVVAAMTAYIAVAPCPLFTSTQLTVVFVALTLVAWSMHDWVLAIAIALAYVAVVMRCRKRGGGVAVHGDDHFTARAPLYMDAGLGPVAGAIERVEPVPGTPTSVPARVQEEVGEDELRALITPELLAAAQSNSV